MKKFLILATILAVPALNAQIFRTVDSAALTVGYANFTPNGFGSGWGLADLTAEFASATEVKMGATQVNDGSDYWIVGGTAGGFGPGNPPAAGSTYTSAKNSEATLYGEFLSSAGDVSYAGQTIEFSVNITEFTLTDGYTAQLAIKQSANGFTPVGPAITGTGIYTTSDIISAADTLVQCGIILSGPTVVPGDQYRFGSLTAVAVPEPGLFAFLLGFAGLGFVFYRRFKG